MSETVGTDRIVTRDDLGTDDAAKWAFWMGEDRIASKEEDRWIKRGQKVVKRYRDERGAADRTSGHKFNILWSNVQTLIPTLYARTPKPDVQRRFLDDDPVANLSSILLERALSYSLEHCEFDAVMEAIVQDRLLPGRGVPRVIYVPHYGDVIPEEADDMAGEDVDTDDDGDGAEDVDNDGDTGAHAAMEKEPIREVVNEEVLASYVYWEDYREGPSRTWKDVPWVRYRAYMTRDQLVERFGAKGKRVNLTVSPKGVDVNSDRQGPLPDIFKKAAVHEYWDKTRKRVIWLAPDTPDVILDDIEDPLGLYGFFPSPNPLLATTTTDSRVPVPDYVQYQDQAQELDVLTARIDILVKALKVVGIYPGSNKAELSQMFDEGTENKLIPIADWQSYADKGGLDKMIVYVPIKQIAETLIQLYIARDKTKELLYEVTGIGDIMRGSTNPNETMGAQQLKANFSTRRIQPQQKAVARIARDVIRLMAGVIATQFEPKTISKITGYPKLVPVPQLPPPPPQMIPAPPEQMQQQAPPPPQPQGPPPEALAQLREGRVTRFGNGSRWTLQNGEPRMVA